jgi:hypothetical protein
MLSVNACIYEFFKWLVNLSKFLERNFIDCDIGSTEDNITVPETYIFIDLLVRAIGIL